ncbi:mitochondrial inner membrane protease ATP23 homolog isoform X1 [Varroa jacobsoni]|uniref:Mitochondrial inner membrane protease ATP23 n=1 Tax=Varroa destructor TaxID=109461 RepID=A0A7M7K155_VARDE|nr:mitochondrial inner membrane protease ATP23 homolog [Varroa destructor]XP_022702110.1 mitochondrial inner membrane protease ATP23 homolog isoform X1 [Varroa jacobsoni]
MVNVSSPLNEDLKGYDLFPERKGKVEKESLAKRIIVGDGGRDTLTRLKCENDVATCIRNAPIVKLMLAALKSSGCEVDPKRHISCEPCNSAVTGGYDAEANQVVICQNNVSGSGLVQGVLAHELLHMFDKCRTKMDYNNNEHVACTEIRAANLLHCSFLSAFVQGVASPFSFSKSHENCVRYKAIQSLVAAKKLSVFEAAYNVDKVFNVCYNDLEPVGRRLRRNSQDMEKAYRDRYHNGYGF